MEEREKCRQFFFYISCTECVRSRFLPPHLLKLKKYIFFKTLCHINITSALKSWIMIFLFWLKRNIKASLRTASGIPHKLKDIQLKILWIYPSLVKVLLWFYPFPPSMIQIRGRNLRQQLWADFIFRVIVLNEFPLQVFLQSRLGC